MLAATSVNVKRKHEAFPFSLNRIRGASLTARSTSFHPIFRDYPGSSSENCRISSIALADAGRLLLLEIHGEALALSFQEAGYLAVQVAFEPLEIVLDVFTSA